MTHFRPATVADFDAIIALRKNNLSNIRWDDEAYFRWRYAFADNEPDIKAGNKVWVLQWQDRLLAMVGVLPFSVCVQDQTCSAVHPLDILVDKSMDGMGVGAWMQLVVSEHADLMLVIGANQNSQSMVKRMFHAMPHREVWKLPIDASIYFRKLSLMAPLSHTLAWLCNTYLGLSFALKSRLYRRNTLQLKAITQFDESVTALMTGWAPSVHFRPRSAAFLNWRFFACPGCDFRAVGLYKEDQLRGYIIYHLAPVSGDKMRVQVDDFFWAEPEKAGSRDDLRAFFMLFAQAQKRQGAVMIEVVSYGHLARALLRKSGFIQRPSENLLFAIACKDASNERDSFNSEQWFITEADAHGAGV